MPGTQHSEDVSSRRKKPGASMLGFIPQTDHQSTGKETRTDPGLGLCLPVLVLLHPLGSADLEEEEEVVEVMVDSEE
ncbi:unnamed protein product [Pleuronectes platessa]|uniref:Uncharacterized protein n=1 Tax=Pleuronectes platessa TaxID=8262 RepID=A0A9N7UH63_PLEPL|nr:unnamed protein product [Pleuronectes platessa]